jgi:hypothetical protein
MAGHPDNSGGLRDRETASATTTPPPTQATRLPSGYSTGAGLDKALRNLGTHRSMIHILDAAMLLNDFVLGYCVANICLVLRTGYGINLRGQYTMAFSTSMCMSLNAIALIVITMILRKMIKEIMLAKTNASR